MAVIRSTMELAPLLGRRQRRQAPLRRPFDRDAGKETEAQRLAREQQQSQFDRQMSQKRDFQIASTILQGITSIGNLAVGAYRAGQDPADIRSERARAEMGTGLSDEFRDQFSPADLSDAEMARKTGPLDRIGRIATEPMPEQAMTAGGERLFEDMVGTPSVTAERPEQLTLTRGDVNALQNLVSKVEGSPEWRTTEWGRGLGEDQVSGAMEQAEKLLDGVSKGFVTVTPDDTVSPQFAKAAEFPEMASTETAKETLTPVISRLTELNNTIGPERASQVAEVVASNPRGAQALVEEGQKLGVDTAELTRLIREDRAALPAFLDEYRRGVPRDIEEARTSPWSKPGEKFTTTQLRNWRAALLETGDPKDRAIADTLLAGEVVARAVDLPAFMAQAKTGGDLQQGQARLMDYILGGEAAMEGALEKGDFKSLLAFAQGVGAEQLKEKDLDIKRMRYDSKEGRKERTVNQVRKAGPSPDLERAKQALLEDPSFKSDYDEIVDYYGRDTEAQAALTKQAVYGMGKSSLRVGKMVIKGKDSALVDALYKVRGRASSDASAVRTRERDERSAETRSDAASDKVTKKQRELQDFRSKFGMAEGDTEPTRDAVIKAWADSKKLAMGNKQVRALKRNEAEVAKLLRAAKTRHKRLQEDLNKLQKRAE